MCKEGHTLTCTVNITVALWLPWCVLGVCMCWPDSWSEPIFVIHGFIKGVCIDIVCGCVFGTGICCMLCWVTALVCNCASVQMCLLGCVDAPL